MGYRPCLCFFQTSEEEDLIEDYDQGLFVLTFGKFLTRSKSLEVCEKHGFEQAKQDFLKYEQGELEEPLVGYFYNHKGMYRQGEMIKTFKDLQEMIDKAMTEKRKFVVTDIGDLLVFQLN